MHQSIKVTLMPVIRAVSAAYRKLQCRSYRIWGCGKSLSRSCLRPRGKVSPVEAKMQTLRE